MRYRATLAYDGTAYFGFQRQESSMPTVQGAVEAVVSRIAGEPVTVIGAGRTDTGVHAIGQVIAFDMEWSHGEETLLRALNAALPPDIAVQALSTTHERFHPRFDAISRMYVYTVIQSPQRQPLLRHRAWYVRQALDLVAMQTAADLLVGQHDFATFGQPPQGSNTVRTVYRSLWTQEPEPFGTRLLYCIEANAFLKHMVRRIVGGLVAVGSGMLSVEQFAERFERRDVSLAKHMAPPQGLVLEAVHYSE